MASLLDFDPTQTPAVPPPTGVDSNFINPPSQVWQPQVAIYATLPIAFILILLRIHTRLRLCHGFGSDDYFCILSMVAMLAYCGVMLAQVTDETYGRHVWDIPTSAITEDVLQLLSAISISNFIVNMFVKVSILLLLRRIFAVSDYWNMMLWVGLGFTVISYTVIIVLWIVYSVPHPGDGGWFSEGYHRRALNTQPTIAVAAGVVGCLTDFYVLAIPLSTVASLRMSKSKKLAVSAVFMTGLLACVLSVVGLAFRVRFYQQSLLRDSFWDSSTVYALSVAEVNIGLICACLPVIFPAVKAFVRSSSSAWASLKESLFSSRQLRDPAFDDSGPDVPASQQGLPEIPRGNLGIVFENRNTCNRRRESLSQGTQAGNEMLPYSELRSMDMDYHKHLV
ncbi:hypothetical protein B0I35DRAFT_177138 [Stachybotrys elegans]|uniref:Rhodopsin domain-containing protein n=1 Tax=Stachybotrys elegans TaxID=80388 RepID=A0A8K0SDF0_9HYPO|nr:hypothetical protein B0I35DRAFT_177138 [Stachybotrys elegans]